MKGHGARRRSSDAGLTAIDVLEYHLKLSPIPDSKPSSSSSSSSSSASDDAIELEHSLFLVAACCFEQAERLRLYNQLIDLGRLDSTYMCVRVSASSSKKRIKRIRKGKSYFLDALDYPVYESHDLEDRDQVTGWLFQMMEVCMNNIQQDWKPTLEVVVVAPKWAISSSAMELAKREMADHITLVYTLDQLDTFKRD